VFLVQLVSYVALAVCSTSIQLGHFYYWFIFLIPVNIVFTIAGVVAWIRDAHYENTLEASHAA
jgi:hypothetical protein